MSGRIGARSWFCDSAPAGIYKEDAGPHGIEFYRTDFKSGIRRQIYARRYDESDGSVTLSLEAMDIVSNGEDLEAAKKALVSDIVEYAEEYYNEFERYSHAPNRKNHLPYVMKALTAETPEELEDAVVCQNGKN